MQLAARCPNGGWRSQCDHEPTNTRALELGGPRTGVARHRSAVGACSDSQATRRSIHVILAASGSSSSGGIHTKSLPTARLSPRWFQRPSHVLGTSSPSLARSCWPTSWWCTSASGPPTRNPVSEKVSAKHKNRHRLRRSASMLRNAESARVPGAEAIRSQYAPNSKCGQWQFQRMCGAPQDKKQNGRPEERPPRVGLVVLERDQAPSLARTIAGTSMPVAALICSL